MHGQQKGGARGMEEAKHKEAKEKKEKEKASALLASLFKGAQVIGKKGKLEEEKAAS